MVYLKLFIISAITLSAVYAGPSAVDTLQDIYSSCIKYFSINRVQPKALQWFNEVADSDKIKITEDLYILRKYNPENEIRRAFPEDIYEKFEDFLQNHDLIMKVPTILSPNSPFRSFFPRSFQPEDVKVPLATTGRSSKLIKKVILPFLLGLKFKTAVAVPLVLALISLKTWKALTLGLLSLVLTGALFIFRLTKPKVNYEVIHYPPHVEHHVDHPVPVAWDHPGYGRELNGNEMAYNGYIQ